MHEISLPRTRISNDPAFEVCRVQTLVEDMEIDHNGTDQEYHEGEGIFDSRFRDAASDPYP